MMRMVKMAQLDLDFMTLRLINKQLQRSYNELSYRWRSIHEDEDEDEESVIHDGMTQGAGASETMPTPVHTELDLYNAFSTTIIIIVIVVMDHRHEEIITNPSILIDLYKTIEWIYCCSHADLWGELLMSQNC